METTLYDENSKSSAKKMKMEMSLDFANDQQKKKQARINEMLSTPDLGLYMLGSPDLERFIIQQNGLVLTTPTPTNQILFPKSVTEEQEAYARGFVDALGELHKNYGTPMVPGTSSNTSMGSIGTGNYTVLGSVQGVTSSNTMKQQVSYPTTLTTTTLLPGSILSQPSSQSVTSRQSIKVVNPNSILVQPKFETAQTVPTFQSSLPSSIAPINLDDQEAAKLDRKRARNRLAATRCRNRKLERIARLEDRVKELKGQNTQLAETAAILRDQVCKLKQDIIEHTKSGCQVMLTHNLI